MYITPKWTNYATHCLRSHSFLSLQKQEENQPPWECVDLLHIPPSSSISSLQPSHSRRDANRCETRLRQMFSFLSSAPSLPSLPVSLQSWSGERDANHYETSGSQMILSSSPSLPFPSIHYLAARLPHSNLSLSYLPCHCICYHHPSLCVAPLSLSCFFPFILFHMFTISHIPPPSLWAVSTNTYVCSKL